MQQDGGNEKLDLTNPPFKTFFLKVFGNDSELPHQIKLPYQVKIAALVVALSTIGFVHAYVMDGMDIYTRNLRGIFFTPTLVIIMASTFIHVLKQIDPTLEQLNKVFQKSEEDFKNFVGDWRKAQTPFFYYSCIVLFVILFFCTTMSAFFPVTYPYVQPDPLTARLVEDGTVSLLTYFYTLLLAVLGGVLIAIGFNRMFYCVRIIHDYGKRFISSEKIDLHQAIAQDSFTSLAKFATKIDLIVAAPTVMSAWYFFEGFLGPKRVVDYGDLFALFACIVTFAFFSTYPLWHLHKELVKAKQRLIITLDEQIQNADRQQDKGIQGILLFHSLLVVRNLVGKMSTWGLDMGVRISFLITFLVPIVFGALLQIWFELLLFP